MRNIGLICYLISLLVKDFEEKEILTEATGHQRNKHYVFNLYLDIYSKS